MDVVVMHDGGIERLSQVKSFSVKEDSGGVEVVFHDRATRVFEPAVVLAGRLIELQGEQTGEDSGGETD